jgi:hypothetical protein
MFPRRIITIILLLSLFTTNLIVVAEDGGETEVGAELSIIPDINQIPQMIPNKQNIIPLNYTDNFGMNWTDLQNFKVKDGSEGIMLQIGKLRSFITTRIVWPLIHPNWKPLLGYTRVVLDADIIGNPSGWTASITPTTIQKSTDGTNATLNLVVYVNDLAAENTVTIRIAATRYDKTNEELGTSYFEIPVRSENLEYFAIKPLEQFTKVTPDSIVNYQIEVTNLGYYVDTFQAKIQTDNDTKAILTEQSMVLNPGETRIVTLQIMTPDNIFDIGTIHTINITGYSIENPEFETYAQVQVKTQGFYFSPLLAFVLSIILIIVVILFIIYRFIFEKREKELYGKPTKPWLIFEEKKYLEKLKKDNPKKYDEVFQMMKNEYSSSLDWYHSVRSSQTKHKMKNENNIFNKILDFIPFINKEKENKQKEADHKIKMKVEEKKNKKTEPVIIENKTSKKPKVIKKEISVKEEREQKSRTSKTDLKLMSSKLVSGLKKWFTVPEEEKRKIEETKKQEIEPKKDIPQAAPKKPKDDYEQEMYRIEKEQKILRAQKLKEQKQVEKEKALLRIRKAQEKQRSKI